MSKLFYIQFLFINILLFHFVANEEKFYIKHNETKWEIDLYTNTTGGSSFYQLLKNNSNTYTIDMYNLENNFLLYGEISQLSFDENNYKDLFSGNIIVDNSDGNYININLNTRKNANWAYCEIFGQVIQSDNFASYFTNLKGNIVIKIQFILEEVFKKPKNLKTLKNMERMIKMKPQGFWKNIGWKSLKSFKSLLKKI